MPISIAMSKWLLSACEPRLDLHSLGKFHFAKKTAETADNAEKVKGASKDSAKTTSSKVAAPMQLVLLELIVTCKQKPLLLVF